MSQIVWQRVRSISIYVSGLLFASSAFAFSIPSSKPLTLMEITNFALQHNPATHQAWAQAKLAAANVGSAHSAYFPQVAAGASVEYSANIFSNPGNTPNSRVASGPNISLNYLLLDFGSRANNARAAGYNLIAANLSQDTVIQQVILQVQQAYYQLLGQQALLTANETSVKEANTSLDAAQALRHNGLATIGDVYQARASLAQAQLNLQQSQGSYQTALGQLATTMGLPVTSKLEVVPLAEEVPTAKVREFWGNFPPHLLQKARQARPDLLAAQAQVQAAQTQLAATKAAALPTIQFAAVATPEGNSYSVNNAAISLNVSIPLFTGFAQTYSERHAAAQVMSAQANRDQLLQQVEWQVWQAYFSLQTAEKAISTTAVLLQSNTQAAQQAQGQYKAGVGNILAVLTTQSDLARARVQNIQAKLNWYIALAQLSAAMGSAEHSALKTLRH